MLLLFPCIVAPGCMAAAQVFLACRPSSATAVMNGMLGGQPDDSAFVCCVRLPCVGESDPIKKNPEDDPWVRSGTQVSEGSGRLLVVATGTQASSSRLFVRCMSIAGSW